MQRSRMVMGFRGQQRYVTQWENLHEHLYTWTVEWRPLPNQIGYSVLRTKRIYMSNNVFLIGSCFEYMRQTWVTVYSGRRWSTFLHSFSTCRALCDLQLFTGVLVSGPFQPLVGLRLFTPPCFKAGVARSDYLPAALLDNQDDMTAAWQTRLSRPVTDWQPIPAVILPCLTPLHSSICHFSSSAQSPLPPCHPATLPPPPHPPQPWPVVSLPGSQLFCRPETKPWP